MGRIYILGYGGLGILILLGLVLINPGIADSSLAESCLDNPTGNECYSTMAEAEVGVTANTAISLAVDASVNMEVTPTSTGATSSASTKLNVSTNSNDGYALYMQAGSDTGNLVNTASMVGSEIKNSSKQDVTLANLEKNSYGYALTQDIADAGTTYSGIPTTGSIIQKTTSVTETEGNFLYGDTYYLSFGVNIGTDIQAGSYTGSVMISAVANPKTLATMFDLTYMQEMTSEICTNTREGYTKRLTDNRDGKQYWVAKLKDGNCWMTQNLALDLDTNDAGNAVAVSVNGVKMELNSTNTDIAGVWKGVTKTETTIPAKGTGGSYTSTKSWNLGSVVQINPTSGDGCADILTGDKITNCQVYRSVDELIASNNPYFATEESSIKGDVYDAHYLIGNYYQWNTATAGSGAATDSKNTGNTAANTDASKIIDASDSICPKGWRLPTSGMYSSGSIAYPFEREDSFENLLKAYGYPAGNADAGWILESGRLQAPLVGSGKTRVDFAPVFFTRSGNIYPSEGALRFTQNGGYWSSSANPASTSTALDFILSGATTVYPVLANFRIFGFSVRCLAR